jgi:hypothetical protein
MKKLAFLTLLALAVAISSCGNGTPANTTTTQSTGNWLAQLTGGKGDASELNFVTGFTVSSANGTSEPLDITGFGFINNGACFESGLDNEHLNGTASITTGSTGQVTGTMTYTVVSITPSGNTLSMTGNLTGTSNGTTTTVGTLSNGIVQGTWTLTGGAGDASCGNQQGDFLMCQSPVSGVCPLPTT